jgi:arylsulfatase A-like enzyme
LFDPENIVLRPNVSESLPRYRKELAGYYAHIAALDACLGDLLHTLEEVGITDDTIFVFTSDHGDMLGSHGQRKKQQPYDESILVPFLIRYPRGGVLARKIAMPFGTPDILPTLLGLSGIPLPATVEGTDFSDVLAGRRDPPETVALIACPHPFGQWWEGRAYRGLRSRRYTYVRDVEGPWLLFDNIEDPYQTNNLARVAGKTHLVSRLDRHLADLLAERGDQFLPGMDYIRRWGYPVDERNTVPYAR